MARTASQHGTPVYVTVWDLSPPSRFATAAYHVLGLGIFHTNLWLPDLSVEWAYGAHAYPRISGVFTLPRQPLSSQEVVAAASAAHRRGGSGGAEASSSAPHHTAPTLPDTLDGISLLGPQRIPPPGLSPIPHARYMGAYFIGYAGPPPPSPAFAFSPTTRWAAPQTGANAFKEPREHCEAFYLSQSASLSAATTTAAAAAAAQPQPSRHPRQSGARLASVNFAMQTLQALRSDPAWTGTAYDLLSNNCNHFTQAACQRLIGANLPAWINRSAALGKSVVWAVPKSLLDIQTGIEPDEYEEVDDVFLDTEHQASTTRYAEHKEVRRGDGTGRDDAKTARETVRNNLQEEKTWANKELASTRAQNT
ncbi:hypothetical protein ACQY0O_001567 [Thecaphora frezii]